MQYLNKIILTSPLSIDELKNKLKLLTREENKIFPYSIGYWWYDGRIMDNSFELWPMRPLKIWPRAIIFRGNFADKGNYREITINTILQKYYFFGILIFSLIFCFALFCFFLLIAIWENKFNFNILFPFGLFLVIYILIKIGIKIQLFLNKTRLMKILESELKKV